MTAFLLVLSYISWGFYETCVAKSPSYLLWPGYHIQNLQFWYIHTLSSWYILYRQTINNLWWAMQTYIPGISKITLLLVDYFFFGTRSACHWKKFIWKNTENVEGGILRWYYDEICFWKHAYNRKVYRQNINLNTYCRKWLTLELK